VVVIVLIQSVKSFVHRISNSIEKVEKSLAERPILRVTTLVIVSMIIVFGTEVALAVIAPWAYARVGFLYFRFDELFGFFVVMLGILLLFSRKRSDWQLDRFFFRSILSLVTISVLWIFINFSDREFACYVLIGLTVFLFSWSFTGTHLKHSVCCALVVILLLVIPFDIVVSSPLRSTEGRHASVQLLEARYGLVRETAPGTYSMGCMVPPNPLSWVLWVDLWPLVDHAFRAYDEFFRFNTRSGNGS
jgi:uncharacterized membrane protein